jgi:SET domain-containing protein
MEDSVTVVALRDIAAGEEVTIDYGAVNSGVNTSAADNFSCRCVRESSCP